MTAPIPSPTVPLKARQHDGPDQSWWMFWSQLADQSAQSSGGLAGLGTAAAKDIGTSGAKVPLLNTANQWSMQQWIEGVDLTEAEALAGWDLNTKQSARLTMTSSFTLAAGLNAKPGATYVLGVDAGAHVLGFDAAFYKFPAGGAIPTTVGKCLFVFWAWSATELWCNGVKEFA